MLTDPTDKAACYGYQMTAEELVKFLRDEMDAAEEKSAQRYAGFQQAAELIETAGRWRLIATAPKDGTRVILSRWSWLNDTDGMNVGSEDWRRRIFDHTAPRKFTMWWATSGFWSDKWGNWNDGIEPSGLNQPTHWMPLPTAKAEAT